MGLVSQRILHCLPGKLHPISKDCERACRAMSAAAICRPDLVHQAPLPIQSGVRGPERLPVIINVRSFGRRPVQLDDLKFFAGSKLIIAAISNVVPPDIEAWELLTDF